MADQEFLASFAVEIDEGGVYRLRRVLEQNRELASSLAEAFRGAKEALDGFFSDLSSVSMPAGLSSFGVSESAFAARSIPVSLDFSRANKELAAFAKNARKAIALQADASGIVSAGNTALSRIKTLFASTKLPLQVELSSSASKQGDGSARFIADETTEPSPTFRPVAVLQAAAGGRFDTPTKTEIAEDGDPEYVIPVRKETLAIPLLTRLFSELSDSARETLRAAAFPDRQLDAASPLHDLPDLLASGASAAAPNISQVSNRNVSAPVSINVTAAGSDPEAVGRSLYDVTERYLLRTMQSALS